MVKSAVDFPVAHIERCILQIREQKVMLDRDLATLYGVETKQLKRAVRRNLDRFPPDFMFELNKGEYHTLSCQIGTLEPGSHSKYLPMVFTEQGVAMLSSVVNSRRAIQVNILIMSAFVRVREMLGARRELAARLKELESRIQDHDEQDSGPFGVQRPEPITLY